MKKESKRKYDYYCFSKLEFLLKGIKFADGTFHMYELITGQVNGLKIFKRKWYNPLRYILATHGVIKLRPEMFV